MRDSSLQIFKCNDIFMNTKYNNEVEVLLHFVDL